MRQRTLEEKTVLDLLLVLTGHPTEDIRLVVGCVSLELKRKTWLKVDLEFSSADGWQWSCESE